MTRCQLRDAMEKVGDHTTAAFDPNCVISENKALKYFRTIHGDQTIYFAIWNYH